MSWQIRKFDACPLCGCNGFSMVTLADWGNRLTQGDWAFVECGKCAATYAHNPISHSGVFDNKE